jgi:hypothetical protein
MVKNTFATGRTNERVDGLIVVLVSFKHIFDNFLTSISKLCNGTDWQVEFILPGNYTLSKWEEPWPVDNEVQWHDTRSQIATTKQ